MASSAVCVLVYECISASIQTLWQAAVVLLHPSGVDLRVCVCALVQYVPLHFWECDCIPARNVCFHRHVRTVWVCAVAIPLHSESHSLKPHQRVCGRQNDKARNQPASACSHTQIHADAHTFILPHKFITLFHLDTRCLLRSLSGSLSPQTHTHTHTFNTSHHYTTGPIQWSVFRPRLQLAAEADVCVCILSHRQTLTKQRAKWALCCRLVLAFRLSETGTYWHLGLIKMKIVEIFIFVCQTEHRKKKSCRR